MAHGAGFHRLQDFGFFLPQDQEGDSSQKPRGTGAVPGHTRTVEHQRLSSSLPNPHPARPLQNRKGKANPLSTRFPGSAESPFAGVYFLKHFSILRAVFQSILLFDPLKDPMRGAKSISI